MVPGGVDPPGRPRVIPFIHHLVRDLSTTNDLLVIAIGHDDAPGTWPLFDAEVVNVPVGRHTKSDVARVVATVTRLATGADVVHGLWANLPGFAAALAGRTRRVPTVVSVCGGEFAAHPDIGYGGGLRRGTLAMARTSTCLATATTVSSAWMLDHVAAAGGHVDEVISLGADLATFSPPLQPAPPARLVHVANINRVKDQTLLLRAMQLVSEARPEATLDIAGLDTLDGEMRCVAERLGITDRTHFHGYLDPPDLAALLRRSTLHVLTSRHDAGPLAVLEAGACRVATVGTPVGHVADLARLADPAAVATADRRPETVAEAITASLADDAGRNDVADQAYRWALAHDSRYTSRSFELLYRRLCAKR